ncbi:hypothetical protein JR050_11080 [Bacillus sp. RD4P76]|uniref:Uncharacterized protein n=2 Tax=Bacillus suaedaesalsae TaxID=2810349 RepID=A0ABS2DI86_9BACI|nr:hypothetical protein [Bacillus suaedaesalsae]
MHLNEYTQIILDKRKIEVEKVDPINELNTQKGNGLTSPTTSTTTEETRLLMDYIDKSNLFTISKADQTKGRILKLRKFFKSKRNQQVEIYVTRGNKTIYKEGKVNTIGRDFVMLTNLKERTWIPYSVIISANIPTGIPNYSNTHQHILFDNNLRKKLLHSFGETVANREVLKQLFFEESLQTNLESWKETWVELHLEDQTKKVGKIVYSQNKKLKIASFREQLEIPLCQIEYIETLRLFTIVSHSLRQFKSKNQEMIKKWGKGGKSSDRTK